MKYILIPLLAILLLPLVSADLNYYKVEYEVSNTVLTTMEFEFKEPTDFSNFDFNLPSDVKEIGLTIIDSEGGGDITKTKQVQITYSTSKYLEGTNHFLTNFKTIYPTDSLTITLKLPIETALQGSIEDSVFPAPSDVTSDGQRIIISWEDEDLDPDENISLFVIFKEKFSFIPYLLALIIIVLAVVIFMLLKKKPKKIQKTEKAKKGYNIEIHLKEDEKQVIRALKRKDGQCTQATLRVITDLSKAKLSRILSELEERKIVHREERGNKKIVTLKKGSWNNLEQDKD